VVIRGRNDDEIGSISWESIVSTFRGVLETYHNAFSGLRNGNSFSTVSPDIVRQGRSESLRYKGIVELRRNAPKGSKNNVKQTGGFCRSFEHQCYTNCPGMQLFYC